MYLTFFHQVGAALSCLFWPGDGRISRLERCDVQRARLELLTGDVVGNNRECVGGRGGGGAIEPVGNGTRGGYKVRGRSYPHLESCRGSIERADLLTRGYSANP